MGVLTAPLAIIKVGGITIGKVRNVRANENIRRGRVTGIGRLTPSELPALEWSGNLTCGFYVIDFDPHPLGAAGILRKTGTIDDFVNTVLLQDQGVELVLQRKVLDTTANGIKVPRIVPFASVRGCFLTSDDFDINEGQISGRNSGFEYTDPIIYPIGE